MSTVTAPRLPSRQECVLPDLLESRASATPQKVFAVMPQETWTYAHAARTAWRWGSALIARGVQPGDCVSVWEPTSPAVLGAWFGTTAAGSIYAPLNLAARGSHLEHTLNLAESKLLVAHAELAPRLAGLDLPYLDTVVITDGDPPAGLPFHVITEQELLAGAAERRPALSRPVEPWDHASLIYTSGTTGPSKGVLTSYASLWAYDRYLIWPDIGPEDRFLQPLPMFHTAGTGMAYSMLRRGGSILLVDGFNPRTFWDDVRRLGATGSLVIHAMVTYLLAQPPSADDAENPLRVVYMGPLSHVKEFSERFGVSVYTGFGMTEVPCPIRSELNPEDEQAMGVRVDPDHFEVRLVDEHDVPVAIGAPGELVVRHTLPWVINSGYKNMPEATARAWRNGWFHTGDQLREGDDGKLYFLDRVKDAIRRRGENISSFEVESEVVAHSDVKEVAAVGIPNPDVEASTGDEEVKVVVVLEPDSRLEAEELIEFLVARMPRYWVPRFVEFVDELPRTPSFKVKKAELRAMGVTAATWDREAAGIKLKREQLKVRTRT
jgi:crotonobetaine/carnitine-CoA ligase